MLGVPLVAKKYTSLLYLYRTDIRNAGLARKIFQLKKPRVQSIFGIFLAFLPLLEVLVTSTL